MNANDCAYLYENGKDILFVKNEHGDFIFRRMFSVSVVVGSGNGTVSGGGNYRYKDVITISSSPAHGYTFGGWSDGNTSQSRQIEIGASNIELRANFNKIPEPTPTPTPTPEPVIPTPTEPTRKSVSIVLSKRKGTVTCTTTPDDASVTWKDSRNKSGTGKTWTHSGQNNSKQTVTFYASKDGYADSSDSISVTKTVRAVPKKGKGNWYGYGYIDDGYEAAVRRWNVHNNNQSKTDPTADWYEVGRLTTCDNWYKSYNIPWDKTSTTETIWS